MERTAFHIKGGTHTKDEGEDAQHIQKSGNNDYDRGTVWNGKNGETYDSTVARSLRASPFTLEISCTILRLQRDHWRGLVTFILEQSYSGCGVENSAEQSNTGDSGKVNQVPTILFAFKVIGMRSTAHVESLSSLSTEKLYAHEMSALRSCISDRVKSLSPPQ